MIKWQGRFREALGLLLKTTLKTGNLQHILIQLTCLASINTRRGYVDNKIGRVF